MTPGHAAVYGAGEIGHYYVQADSFHATILSTLHPVIRDKEQALATGKISKRLDASTD